MLEYRTAIALPKKLAQLQPTIKQQLTQYHLKSSTTELTQHYNIKDIKYNQIQNEELLKAYINNTAIYTELTKIPMAIYLGTLIEAIDSALPNLNLGLTTQPAIYIENIDNQYLMLHLQLFNFTCFATTEETNSIIACHDNGQTVTLSEEQYIELGQQLYYYKNNKTEIKDIYLKTTEKLEPCISILGCFKVQSNNTSIEQIQVEVVSNLYDKHFNKKDNYLTLQTSKQQTTRPSTILGHSTKKKNTNPTQHMLFSI